MNTYTFKINGMTCHACESLITMDLEDAGLPTPQEIDAQTGTMIIALDDAQVEAVTAVIAASNTYTVQSVNQQTV